MKTLTAVQGKQTRGFKQNSRRRAEIDPRYKLKDAYIKRQKMVQSVVAGHVRGGHSFH